MASVRDLSAGEVVAQMGFAPTENQNGGWRATRSYYMLDSTWESATIQTRFKRGTSVSTADPSISNFYSFLTVESKSASYEDSGTVLLTVTYTGSANAQFGGEGGTSLTLEALPIYRLEGRLRELPLSEHPKWDALSDQYKAALGYALRGDGIVNPQNAAQIGNYVTLPDNTLQFAPLEDATGTAIDLGPAGDAYNFAVLIRQGRTTYLAPSFVWTETTQGDAGITVAQINNLGIIDPSPRGNPPVPSTSHDWLLTSASQEQQGDLYQTTLEWTMSESVGWNTHLYER